MPARSRAVPVPTLSAPTPPALSPPRCQPLLLSPLVLPKHWERENGSREIIALLTLKPAELAAEVTRLWEAHSDALLTFAQAHQIRPLGSDRKFWGEFL